jgi:hypothetical protein
VEYHIEHLQKVLQILKDNLTMAHNRMKHQENQHRSEISFEVGDWVLLSLQENLCDCRPKDLGNFK